MLNGPGSIQYIYIYIIVFLFFFFFLMHVMSYTFVYSHLMISCCRFLKARKFDMDKTVHMWAEMLNWRKEYGVDSFLKVRCHHRMAALHPPSSPFPLCILNKNIIRMV